MSEYRPYRKRRAGRVRVSDPFSLELRKVQRLTHHGESAEVVSILDRLDTQSGKDSVKRAKVLSARARLLEKTGDREAAARTLGKAAQVARVGGDSRYWIGPAVNEVAAWLRLKNRIRAEHCARVILENALRDNLEWKGEIDDAESSLTGRNRVVEVRPRPYAVGVVATRLGGIYYEHLHLEEAAEFLRHAVEESPRGASKARMLLARIFYDWEDYEQAEKLARESLFNGHFGSKTVANWEIYIAARDFQGKALLEEGILDGLISEPAPSVRARGFLSIVRELRSRGSKQWLEVSDLWLTQFFQDDPVVYGEIMKIALAEQRCLQAGPELVATSAHRILALENSGPTEMIAAAKVLVMTSIVSGAEPRVEPLVRKITRRHGQSFDLPCRHALGLGAMRYRKWDLAERLFSECEAQSTPGANSTWGQAKFRLAELTTRKKGALSGRDAYLEIFKEDRIGSPCRLAALVKAAQEDRRATRRMGAEMTARIDEYVEQVILTNTDLGGVSTAAGQLLKLGGDPSARATLRKIDDYVKGLSQNPFSGDDSLEEDLKGCFSCGVYLSKSGGAWSELVRLWKLVNNLDRFYSRRRTAGYSSLLSCSLHALLKMGDREAVEEFVESETLKGVVCSSFLFGIRKELGFWHFFRRDPSKSLECFDWIVTSFPSRRNVAPIHYWLGLRKLIGSGELESAENNEHFVQVCRSLENHHSRKQESDIYLRARILMRADNEVGFPEELEFEEAYLARQIESLEKDKKIAFGLI